MNDSHTPERFPACGHLNGHAKLRPEQVQAMRAIYAQRYEPGKRVTIKQLARQYGISMQHCFRILHREVWQHV